MIDIKGLKAEKIDEENVRLIFDDGSSLVVTVKEERGSKVDSMGFISFPTIAYVMRLALMVGFSGQPGEPTSTAISEKSGRPS
jgi:hypothetical protein